MALTPLDAPVVPGGVTRNSNGNSGPLQIRGAQQVLNNIGNGQLFAPTPYLNLLVVSEAAPTGTTPSLTLTVEWSADGVTFAPSDPVDTFTAITTQVNAVKRFAVKAPFYRVVWTITGTTPVFTFRVHETDTLA